MDEYSNVAFRVFKGLADQFSTRVNSWALTGMLLNIGFILVSHPNYYIDHPIYVFMMRVAGPNVWGIFCIVIGGARLLMLTVNGTFKVFQWSAHVRAVLACLSCIVWLQMSFGFLVNMSFGLGSAVYPFLLLLEIHNAINAAQEAAIKAVVDKRLGHPHAASTDG